MSSVEKAIFQGPEYSEFLKIYDNGQAIPAAVPFLDTDFVGAAIYYFREINSTSIKAYELAQSGVPEGTVVVAESQSRGKGRRGREWHSPEGENIYTSVIFRPPLDPSDASRLTLVAAVALAETISCFLGDSSSGGAGIKWPNDVLIDNKKCAGILTEMKCNGSRIDFIVIGIGINVNMSVVPPELSSSATSISMERGDSISRTAVLQKLYSNLESWYKRYLLEGFLPVMERWNALSAIRGKEVRAASGIDAYEEGRALGINDDGSLQLEKQDGSLINVTVGDINIL